MKPWEAENSSFIVFIFGSHPEVLKNYYSAWVSVLVGLWDQAVDEIWVTPVIGECPTNYTIAQALDFFLLFFSFPFPSHLFSLFSPSLSPFLPLPSPFPSSPLFLSSFFSPLSFLHLLFSFLPSSIILHLFFSPPVSFLHLLSHLLSLPLCFPSLSSYHSVLP